MSFKEYVDHGWSLVEIRENKRPTGMGWNKTGETDTRRIQHWPGAGLRHAFSGTCAFDIDNMDATKDWFEERGLDLYDLLDAEDAVKINSGNPGHDKLLYALDTPLPSKQFTHNDTAVAFELRCGTMGGKTMQDVLPPSPHPTSGKNYEWDGPGDWRKLPPLPAELRAIWEASLPKQEKEPVQETITDPVIAKPVDIQFRNDLAAIKVTDVKDYYDWLKVGMALHYETNGSAEGLQIWDEWSQPDPKYKGFKDLATRWKGFGLDVDNPVRWGAVLEMIVASVDEFEVLEDEPEEEKRGFMSLSELRSIKPPDWIVEDILPEGELGAIYGAPGAGKTFVAISLAMAVATGGEWLGREVKQGNVLYVAAEDGTGVNVRLFAALDTIHEENAAVRTLIEDPNVTTDAGQNRLYGLVQKEGKATVILVDTMAATTAGADENAAKDMTKVVSFWKKVSRATGAIVILIHHSGKDKSKGVRGSSALGGAFDFIWYVEETPEKRTMTVEKLKNARRGMSYTFKLILRNKTAKLVWDD